MSYTEEPVQILDRKEKQLRSKNIPLVKILWRNQNIEEATEKIKLIKERMKAAQSRQKAYADNRRRPLEFEVGDKVFLKVSPTGNKNKLAPRYIGPFEILDRIGPVAYRLAYLLFWRGCTMYFMSLS